MARFGNDLVVVYIIHGKNMNTNQPCIFVLKGCRDGCKNVRTSLEVLIDHV